MAVNTENNSKKKSLKALNKGRFYFQFSLVSHTVVSNSLQPHKPQHARPPCPSPTLGVHPNPRPLSPLRVHLTLCLSLLLLPSIFSSLRVFEWALCISGQSIETSASVLPMNIQGWLPLGLAGLISLQSKGLSRVFSNTTVEKHQFFSTQLSLWSNSHIHTWLLEKP